MERKISDKEDRDRRNNLRFDGLIEEVDETWEQSEVKIHKFLREKLEIISEVEIERAHRSGRLFRADRTRNEKRTIVVKFLRFKDKQNILDKYIKKKLWTSRFYVNEDFSEKTLHISKDLFKQVKDLKLPRVRAKVCL